MINSIYLDNIIKTALLEDINYIDAATDCLIDSEQVNTARFLAKDDGVLFDISEEDVSVTSLASFAVSAYMEKLGEDRRHLTTMSFNRSAFLIKPIVG